ncbi:2-oxo acid dehydrogenase subunit E2 [Streptomyces sp. DSM 44918]|uniref:2-oxo acid dehydrogenase subunit E2 n=1 Tax=Streptomyces millisiae TaxID=3075542 RepID=A0ABU2LTF1_9ACTN|nr:2-oxo acid dehydrogenase subunit E2 [Streptomyces sp. DSM 44918]MDT0320876.1 2-oxo acid dehydrogenase subunit E2 [Streptomyces sp. DSM 44918]
MASGPASLAPGGRPGAAGAMPPGGASPGALRAQAGGTDGGFVPGAEGAGGPADEMASGPVPVVSGGTPPTHGGGAAMPPGDAVPTTPSAPAGAGASGPDGARGGAAPSAAVGAGADGPAGSDGPAVAVVSPLVRRLAREVGVDLRSVTGTGPGGLIMRADVLNASPHPARGEAAPAGGLAAPGDVVVEMRGVARVMAERVAASRRDVADATCWVEADATGLMEARRVVGVPVTALLARICLAALARHPQLNASVDMAARRITRHGAVHLGFAAATERGLLVPVVRDAHAMDTGRLAAELRRLTEGARAGTLAPAEVTGSTFTLNNYGVFGVDGSTPIVNAPEVGMLGVGRIVEKPWAHEGRLALRQVVQLSLTFDHRACDGAVAGGFLRFVADRVEQPLALLGDL